MRRLSVLILCFGFILSVFSGCGSNKPSNDSERGGETTNGVKSSKKNRR